MTVKELIEQLKKFPENQTVVFSAEFGSGDVLNITEVFSQEFDDWENPDSEELIETCMIWSESVYSSCIPCEIVGYGEEESS